MLAAWCLGLCFACFAGPSPENRPESKLWVVEPPLGFLEKEEGVNHPKFTFWVAFGKWLGLGFPIEGKGLFAGCFMLGALLCFAGPSPENPPESKIWGMTPRKLEKRENEKN